MTGQHTYHRPNPMRRELDDYPTPAKFTEALLDRFYFSGTILEPAAGRGDMFNVIRNQYPQAIRRCITEGQDFFNNQDDFDNIITNPPYKCAQKFVEKALHHAPFVAMLLPLYFAASISRRELFNACPPCDILAFAERMRVESNKGIVTSAFAHAWFVWDLSKPRVTRFSLI